MSHLPRPLDLALGEEFRVADALACGHTERRMRASDLVRPFHGVRQIREQGVDAVDPDEPLARDRAARAVMTREARAYFAVAPPHTFLAGRSAAVAWSLPCDIDDDLWIGVHFPHRAPRRPEVRGLTIIPSLASVRVHDGLRLTSPASTWAMLGGELDHRDLVVLGDAIVRIPRDDRGRPRPDRQLATPAELRAASEATRRMHRWALRAALADIRVGSMSPLETDFRLLAARAGLPEPELDAEIRDAAGRLLGISDAVYVAQRTIVEVEGDHHRVSRAQWQRDIEKYAAYAAERWEVVRLTSGQVRGPNASGARLVGSVLRRRGLQS